jgi:membrane-bound lytic murein transglycosylase A
VPIPDAIAAGPDSLPNGRRVDFGALPGWAADDHAAALITFQLSLPYLLKNQQAAERWPQVALNVLYARLAEIQLADRAAARAFFETYFVPHEVPASSASPNGFLTAYYEPVLRASRTQSAAYPVPLHRRPADLINLVGEADRATSNLGANDGLTHARQTPTGPVPYATRRAIDEGALEGRNLELFFLADVVDRFFLQVQGSGVLVFDDGRQIRVGYDGKNGHLYTSLGRLLVDEGRARAEQMSLDYLSQWLRDDPVRGAQTIWRNESYVFFRELPQATAPEGVLGVPLTPLRSLAIDPSHTALGLPVYLDAPTIDHLTAAPFRHLMIAQDVGSAIRGPARGDIFVGTGDDAGRRAGITKHSGRFFVLKPKSGEWTP